MAQSSAIQGAIKQISAELQEHEEKAQMLRSTLALLTGTRGRRNAKGVSSAKQGRGGRRKLSAAGRAAISRAAKKRWADYNKAKAKNGKK